MYAFFGIMNRMQFVLDAKLRLIESIKDFVAVVGKNLDGVSIIVEIQ